MSILISNQYLHVHVFAVTSVDLLTTSDMKNIKIPSLNKTFQVFWELFQLKTF